MQPLIAANIDILALACNQHMTNFVLSNPVSWKILMQQIASITPKEVEVKLEMDPTSLQALKKIPLFRALKAVPTQSAEVSVYFDTDMQTLRKKGLMLRVRRKDGRYIQTIKAGPDRKRQLEWKSSTAKPLRREG